MKKHLANTSIFSILLIIAGLVLVAMSLTLSPKSATAQEGNPVRGGLLYDEWWAVLDVDAPAEDQPLWSTQTTNTRAGSDTWRCKECHGWDYKGVDGAYGSGSHTTGFPGILDSAGQPVEDILATLQGSTNPDHDFSTVMAEQDLLDLAAFMSQALLDTSPFLNEDHSSKGDAANGEGLYGEVCILCHGPEGNAINFNNLAEPEFLAHVATENPWEFFHKVRFGQAGWPMPSGINNGWSDQDVADVLAYVATFTTEPALSGGGPLYDEWWAALDLPEPTDNQPLWSTQTTNERSGADTWRCKECHGWDYRGAAGAYGSGSHLTGFVGVVDAASMSPDELLAWLNGQANADHDFSGVMDEAALNALVVFLQTEAIDITPYVNADGTVNGDPRNGRDLFGGTCAVCHGVDGKTLNFGDEDAPEYVGTVATDNPWEFFHKASFGQPGKPMPAGRALGWSLQDIADVLSYAQTLPTE